MAGDVSYPVSCVGAKQIERYPTINLYGGRIIMSRRKGRYLRRQAKRKANLMKRNSAIGGLHEVFGYDDMYQAGKQCCKGVRWKNSTQRFEMHLFSGTARRRKLLLAHKFKIDKYIKHTPKMHCFPYTYHK